MSTFSPLKALGLSQRPKLGTAEVESLIDNLPEAAFIVDLKQQTVVMGNSKATKLTAYTRAELSGLPLKTLFSTAEDAKDQLIDLLKNPELELRLDINKRGGSRTSGIATIVNLNPAKNYHLITLESTANLEQRQQAQERQEQIWDIMQTLVSAPIHSDVDESLQTVLKACQSLTGSDFLAVYQASGEQPSYIQKARLGEQSTFPEKLSPTDLPSPNDKSFWMIGKRPTTFLHRIARSAGFTYIFTLPIGIDNANIGLFLIAGHNQIDQQYLEIILETMTTYMNSLMQGYFLINHLSNDNRRLQQILSVTSIIQEKVEEGIIVLTPELTVASINSAAENYLGYSHAEVIGQSIHNILIGSEVITSAFKASLPGRFFSSEDPVKLFRRDGNAFPANLKVIPISSGDDLQNFLVIFQDLSEQEEYRMRNQQLEQRALLGEVTASFAHEVRNPINNISTGLQLLAYNLPEDDPNQDNINRLKNDCERLTELVKSSLSFVRPMEYKLEPIDIASFLSQTVERWKPRFERNNIKPHLQVEDNLPSVEGDIRALDQVLTNLINNAMQAMGNKEGVLALKARRLLEPAIPSQIEISVSDTGPGIPPEIRDRIFEPFFTTKQSGTGLGLAIVKRIVTAHKGAIHVNSMPGGTIFSVILPAIRETLKRNGDA